MTSTRAGNRLSVDGLQMYYELFGAGRPVVLLHGAMSTIETSFGAVLPLLAETRQVVAVEQQAHGHTADIDRPLTYRQMADDTAGLLQQLELERCDFFGYSMGAGIALEIAIRRPQLVRRLVVASLASSKEGFHPEIVEAIESTQPEDLAGSVFHEAYAKTAPNPENWSTLIRKCNQLDREFEGWPPTDIESITAPTLLITGDSDIVRPEHAVQMFRLLGGGVEADVAGLPPSQLAVLPATTHLTLVERADWLVPMISAFLDAPLGEPSDRLDAPLSRCQA
jgi:pimeloyl-ACP methyl ester carboxylesterase